MSSRNQPASLNRRNAATHDRFVETVIGLRCSSIDLTHEIFNWKSVWKLEEGLKNPLHQYSIGCALIDAHASSYTLLTHRQRVFCLVDDRKVLYLTKFRLCC